MLQTAYRFDKDGYYAGTCSVQDDGKGGVLLPSDCTLLEPVFYKDAFTKFDGKAWVAEYYPLTCAEAIEQNFTAISNGPGQHNLEKRAIIEALVAADTENYRTKVDENFIMSIEEISEEEKQAKEDEAAKAALEADIAAVREDMMTAIAINDDEWLEELRAEYEELVNGGEN